MIIAKIYYMLFIATFENYRVKIRSRNVDTHSFENAQAFVTKFQARKCLL